MTNTLVASSIMVTRRPWRVRVRGWSGVATCVVLVGMMAVAGEAACWAARLRRLRAEARPRPPDLDDDDLVVVLGPTALVLLRTLGCSCRRWGGTVVFFAVVFCFCCLALDLVRGLVLPPLPLPFFLVLLPPPLLAILG